MSNEEAVSSREYNQENMSSIDSTVAVVLLVGRGHRLPRRVAQKVRDRLEYPRPR
jgi:hypothetical protein